MNSFSFFSVGRRFILSSSLTFVATLLLSTFTTLEVAAQQPLKLNTKPQIVTFLGTKGDGGSPCDGIGMCRGAMLNENESATASSRDERSVLAQGRFSLQNGKLNFILTHVAASNGTNITNINSFPFDHDTELPRDMARSLGFASVRVFKSRYPASMEGVFPVQAKFSNGLNAASVAAPRGERHASVSFEVLRQMNVSVFVLDAQGNRVATLLNNVTIEGSETAQNLVWNGKNDAGKRMASGAYRVEVRSVLPESGASFAENVAFVLAPVSIAD